jgi:hypothetical protein
MFKKALFSKFFGTRAVVPVALAVALAASNVAPAQAAYVKAGVLTCNVGPSIGLLITQRKDMSCTFSPTRGTAEHYAGTLRKWGLAVGATGQGVIVWAVLSAVNGVPPRGALAGEYGGASAEASVVVGAGANILVGGSNRSFALQPLSVEGQIGLNFAIGISDLMLAATQ